mmetsp:Transcript_18975/g.27435  ORF Transcript_18975/g.27435 Transcript_18975/m.27435 type:complete len:902 (+) Transcript_18975:710-3415(+)
MGPQVRRGERFSMAKHHRVLHGTVSLRHWLVRQKNKESGEKARYRGGNGIESGDSDTAIDEDSKGEHNISDNNSVPPHPLCMNSSQYGRSKLHEAVCSKSIEGVKNALKMVNVQSEQTTAEKKPASEGGEHDSQISKKLVSQCDNGGFFPIHSAAALGMLRATSDDVDTAVEITRILLDAGADALCRDEKMNTPLHWAARAGNEKLIHILTSRSCPLDVQNKDGETALHWAMRAGTKSLKAVQKLLQDGARSHIFNHQFKRPLDVAAEGFGFDDAEPIGSSQSNLTPNKDAQDKSGGKSSQPDSNKDKRSDDEKLNEKRLSRVNFLRFSPQSRTLILHHPECLDHIPKSEHDWEVPDRVKSIMNRIQDGQKNDKDSNVFDQISPHEVTISTEFDRATLELLSRVHSADYLAFVNDLSKELERRRKKKLVEENKGNGEGGESSRSKGFDPSVVPFTPMVQQTMMRESTVKKGAHSDTSFSAGSLRAARRAAGAVQHAVDRVLVGRNRNAFCVVRPPGHHAGVNGLLAGGESCGFCIFNNIAAGAMHALSDERHRPRCERCAIVDIDVHHGNGTEEIVRKNHDPTRLLFFSVHLFDHDKRKSRVSGSGSSSSANTGFKFYPGTGEDDDVAHNVINVPLAPLWRDKDVLQSTSGATSSPPIDTFPLASHHNTRHRAKQKAAAAAVVNDSSSSPSSETLSEATSDAKEKDEKSAKESLPSDSESLPPDVSQTMISKSGGGQRSKSPVSSPSQPAHYQMGVGRQAYRRAIQHRLIPALRAFNPDLILISTGFDASRGDVGNARHYAGGRERMGLDLEPEDYAWTTRKIIEVADICCQGRVVSVLEGGYGRTTQRSTDVKVDTRMNNNNSLLDKTMFAECAMKHLYALTDPYDAEQRHSKLSPENYL